MDVESLLALCQTEVAALDALQHTLEEEQRAILRFDAFNLEEMAHAKLRQLDDLTAAREARLGMQERAGYTDAAHWQVWLQQAPSEVRQLWQSLEKGLVKLKALNDVNAELAQERMKFASEVLDSLKASNQAVAGYGRQGNLSSTLSGSRRLGSA
ncbi:flagella synthesis protein FlgN [Vogesella oryzae]|uniref:flagella synthesis protein FlgN n=1 Tax=Vogesella oryzae TaxID=1735285 RepID=UPI0015824B10|nr:flagellar protein FlgN [Vogesella oryzae]